MMAVWLYMGSQTWGVDGWVVEEGCVREEMGRGRRRSKVGEGSRVEGERLVAVAVGQEEGERREVK